MGIQSDGQVRLLRANTTNAAAVLAAGRYQIGYLNAANAGLEEMIFSLGPPRDSCSNVFSRRKRGCIIAFFGVGAANSTMGFRLWQFKQGFLKGDGLPRDFSLELLGVGTATLGTDTTDALSGNTSDFPVPTDQKMADTITYTPATVLTTPKGISELISGGLLAPDPVVYSPEDDTCAYLMVPDVGSGDILLELCRAEDWTTPTGSSVTSCNALVEAFE